MKAKQRRFKVTRELCHEWFHHFRHPMIFITATGLENSPQSFGVYTVSQSRSVVTSVENPAQVTRLSQLENSAMGTWPIYKNSIIPDWFEKWRDIKF